MRVSKQLMFVLAAGVMTITSCSRDGRPTSRNPGDVSTATGIEYDEEEGFGVADYSDPPEGPGLVFIEGGRTTLGSAEEDIALTRDNIERTVTVASFYMDEAEVANIHWLEYLHYMRDTSEALYKAALPDTSVWERELSFNDPYVNYYLRYPGFRYYPVVGVDWKQANDYCIWRTQMVNKVLAQDYDGELAAGASPPIESGAVLPNYRLPTEAEWEYAAQALIGVQLDEEENQLNKRIYPWDGHQVRNPYGRDMGQFLANFKRGRGDYAGIAGSLNDGAMITEYIYAYPPNDFGLYNMAGNVNEWVMDVYRPLSYNEMEDLNPVRRNGVLDDTTLYKSDDFQTLLSNTVRVYKGGSWKDVAYWLSPGTRRFLEQDSATSTIGFRCAMINTGSNR